MISSVKTGDDLHNHWDKTVEFVKNLTFCTDFICLTGGLGAMISLGIHFWQFRHGQKRHTIKKHSCVRLSRMILKNRMEQYFKANPMGPAGVQRGITWFRKCPETENFRKSSVRNDSSGYESYEKSTSPESTNKVEIDSEEKMSYIDTVNFTEKRPSVSIAGSDINIFQNKIYELP